MVCRKRLRRMPQDRWRLGMACALVAGPDMRQDKALLPEMVLRNYVHAKDENRPHFLDATFEADAQLEVRNSTTAIAFPAITTGRAAIADVLVRTFCQTYENVYTFYLARPVGPLEAFECGWLVAMTDKATRSVRVGCGRYEWTFGRAAPRLASSLVISISSMQVLPAEAAPEILAWVSSLSYPWSSPAEALMGAPGLPELQPVLRQLGAT